MSKTKTTLFVEKDLEYFEQIRTSFEKENYSNAGQNILKKPKEEGDDLHIELILKKGGDQHVVHDFSIGLFPPKVKKWHLYIDYKVIGSDDIIYSVSKTEQGEADAEPRPIN